MAERDYTNDYEDWLRQQEELLFNQGKPEEPGGAMAPVVTPPASVATAPPVVTPPANTGTTNPPPSGRGGMDPNNPPKEDPPPGTKWQFDPANGWFPMPIGITNSPPGPGTTDSVDTGSGALAKFDSSGFTWPTYTAPTYQSPGPFTPRQDTFTPRQDTFKPSQPTFSYDAFTPSQPTFSYDPFTAPTAEQARNSPGYQAAATEARKQLEAGAAYRGTLRSGMTLGDILKQQTALGDQNYNNVFGRELEGYNTNRGNAFNNWAANTGNELNTYKTNRDNAYSNWEGNLGAEKTIFDTNFGVDKTIFDTNYGIDTDIYDRMAADVDRGNNYRFNASQAEFAPKQRSAELTFADLYSRWRDLLNSTTQIATAGD